MLSGEEGLGTELGMRIVVEIPGMTAGCKCRHEDSRSIRKTSPSQIEINSTTGHYVALIINLG